MTQIAFAELQKALLRQMRELGALTESVAATELATSVLTGSERLRPVDQLEIYRQQYWLRHTGSLLEDFPGLGGILGQAAWERLVESYLESYPPNSWTLRDLGHRMPEHVRANVNLPHYALCVDMARLEWAYTELFDARQEGPLDATKLERMSPESWNTARVVVSAAVRLLRVAYPVARLRRQLRLRSEAALTEPVTLPEADPQNLVLYRDPEGNLCYSRLGQAAAALFEALLAGHPLLEACERAVVLEPKAQGEIEAKLGTWFATWGAKGWIVDVVEAVDTR
ncbi:MAG TPA: DNA-binding domain-containing protein [Polyangiaceae bacterium]|jgi:hypothetical protein|nr:DNA-binding domain-containing protein [Polyangiaceae bacterium]